MESKKWRDILDILMSFRVHGEGWGGVFSFADVGFLTSTPVSGVGYGTEIIY